LIGEQGPASSARIARNGMFGAEPIGGFHQPCGIPFARDILPSAKTPALG